MKYNIIKSADSYVVKKGTRVFCKMHINKYDHKNINLMLKKAFYDFVDMLEEIENNRKELESAEW